MRKVLVVDDSAMVRTQVSRALGAAGFEVLEAANGAVALRVMMSDRDVELVVCDLNMPVMDGLDFLEAVQRVRADNAPAVVMLSSSNENEHIERAKQLGAKGWMRKPFNAGVLVATARKLTGGVR